ncbi:MAG: radical SAM protein, partial [Desulfosarcinaceae bacterium]
MQIYNHQIDFYFDLNDGCNLDCIMCGGRRNRRDQKVMAPGVFEERVLPVFEHVEDFQFGCRYEPLLGPNYQQVLAMLQSQLRDGLKGRTVTNGTLMTPRLAENMIASNIFRKISISVDGPNRAVYETIRRGAKFDHLYRNLRVLSETRRRYGSGTEIEIIFTIMPQNVQTLPDMVDLAAATGVDSLKTHKRSPQDCGAIELEYHRMVTNKLHETALAAAQKGIVFSGQQYWTVDQHQRLMRENTKSGCRCAMFEGRVELWMDPHGVMHSTCKRMAGPIGNLTRDNLRQILTGKAGQRLFHHMQHPDTDVCTGCYLFQKAEKIDQKMWAVDLPTTSEASELDRLIPPEIKDDAFYRAIRRISGEKGITHILEIGSSAGEGSTAAFVEGIRSRTDNVRLYCLEISRKRFQKLEETYESEKRVICCHASSVPLARFPDEAEVATFYRKTPTALNDYPLQRVLGWLRQDKDYIRNTGICDQGIEKIRRESGITTFDAVLIDGSEFTGRAELDLVYGARVIMLDDINGFKNLHNYNRLIKDTGYRLEEEDQGLRNGYAIFRRVDDIPQAGIPIHFFTIVLNGEPFIRYHLEVFKKLSIPWHWHIVEGVAELKHDTAWSVQRGGHISSEFHDKGLSRDGTSTYLDTIATQNPHNITLYRPEGGEFWEGKRAMVNAPLANIRQDCLLWQVDVDELWRIEQIKELYALFNNQPKKTSAFIYCDYFVGPHKYVSSIDTWATRSTDWLRVWRFAPGMRWTAHEPPT